MRHFLIQPTPLFHVISSSSIRPVLSFQFCFYACVNSSPLVVVASLLLSTRRTLVAVESKSCPTLRPCGLQNARLLCPPLSPQFAQIHVHWVGVLSNHPIPCCPLLLLPSIFPSIRVFSSESTLHIRWPKYWSFSISPFNEHSGLISLTI